MDVETRAPHALTVCETPKPPLLHLAVFDAAMGRFHRSGNEIREVTT